MPKTDSDPTPTPPASGFLRAAFVRAMASNLAPGSLPQTSPPEPRAAQAPTPLTFFRGALAQAYGGRSWSPSTPAPAAPAPTGALRAALEDLGRLRDAIARLRDSTAPLDALRNSTAALDRLREDADRAQALATTTATADPSSTLRDTTARLRKSLRGICDTIQRTLAAR